MLFSGNRTGEYLRLSREDGDKLESDSIKNQRELIKEFLIQHQGLNLVEEYVDDGYSGTSYERPAFIHEADLLFDNRQIAFRFQKLV